MKYKFVLFSVVGLLLICGCTSSTKKSSETIPETIEKMSTPPELDTSFYFIKRILNSSPKEVQNILGKPDNGLKKSKDCDYLPECQEAKYRNGDIEVLYYNDKLKWITVENIVGKYYDDNSIEMLNFPKSNPDLQTNFFKHWKGYDGIKLIGIFAKSENNSSIDYILINVETDYNEKFIIVGDVEINAQAELRKEEDLTKMIIAKERKQRIENQFNLKIDGSHIELTKRIKTEMNNPSSFEHISTKYFDLGDDIKVVTDFRGQNKFGATVKNTAIAIVDIQGNIINLEYNN